MFHVWRSISSFEKAQKNVSNENAPPWQNSNDWKDFETSIQNMAQHLPLNLKKFSFAFPFFLFLITQQIHRHQLLLASFISYSIWALSNLSPSQFSFFSLVFNDRLTAELITMWFNTARIMADFATLKSAKWAFKITAYLSINAIEW